MVLGEGVGPSLSFLGCFLGRPRPRFSITGAPGLEVASAVSSGTADDGVAEDDDGRAEAAAPTTPLPILRRLPPPPSCPSWPSRSAEEADPALPGASLASLAPTPAPAEGEWPLDVEGDDDRDASDATDERAEPAADPARELPRERSIGDRKAAAADRGCV